MIVYNDPRRFGFFKIFNNQKTLKDYFSRSGQKQHLINLIINILK